MVSMTKNANVLICFIIKIFLRSIKLACRKRLSDHLFCIYTTINNSNRIKYKNKRHIQ